VASGLRFEHGGILQGIGFELISVGRILPAIHEMTLFPSGVAGTHIVYLDYSHLVDLQVASTDTFLIHNANTETPC
jgi:hypothetical protein